MTDTIAVEIINQLNRIAIALELQIDQAKIHADLLKKNLEIQELNQRESLEAWARQKERHIWDRQQHEAYMSKVRI